ncbi:MAG: anaerobic ribonucleoside-triphosphate reductase activating protein [Caldiserica bacterium]|nr:anaerobic ribonucleoside-triphosphate reductase activating protein [Caldisericota bacterium]NCQ53082.1 anaerobic ribonucleoside-triphosphate reductase activating protein [Caldisericota bacterium]PIW10543.1 MAG: anaerobic ribonucleoside-triphosphate reductase activating protein [Caldiserica bacterium CG17_big_fil_post_rev_8_21_14_2_50_35_7]
MLIGGLTKFSLIDYPGHTCAIIFTQGCNFRCPYCQNPELVLPEMFTEKMPTREVIDFLKKRAGLLDAVEFTGGEPTMQIDLIEFAREIKNMGFKIKVDTNGTIPETIEEGLKARTIDYIAMDIKASLDRYEEVVKVSVNKEKIKRSIEIIMKDAPDYEFRTTVIKGFHDKDEIERIGKTVNGASKFFIQRPQFYKTVEKGFKRESFSNTELEEFKDALLKYVKTCAIR